MLICIIHNNKSEMEFKNHPSLKEIKMNLTHDFKYF